MMFYEICQSPDRLLALMIALKVLDGSIEYWLGKTDKVKAGSVLELVLNGLRALIKIVSRRNV